MAVEEKYKSNLEWVPVSESPEGFSYPAEESAKEKLFRKIKSNPAVPIGMIATTGALTYGLWCMRTGNKRKSQIMMRARVGAQGFTIIAIIVGIAISASRNK